MPKKAITTTFLSQTRNLPMRISAKDADHNRVTIDYPDLPTIEGRHRAAAIALCDKMGWKHENLVCGYLNPSQWVFVFNED